MSEKRYSLAELRANALDALIAHPLEITNFERLRALGVDAPLVSAAALLGVALNQVYVEQYRFDQALKESKCDIARRPDVFIEKEF